MGQLVPTTHTPATAEQVRDAFAHAWVRVASSIPTLEGLAVLVAHSSFETGHWGSMFCFNLGNVKHVDGDGHDWMYLVADEYVDPATLDKWKQNPHWVEPKEGVTPKMRDGKIQIWLRSAFRAFPSWDEGVMQHISFLNRHFAIAWGYAEAADPGGYVQALYNGHYFTGSFHEYVTGVTALHRHYVAAWVPPAA